MEASNLLDCNGKNVLLYYTTHTLHAPHGDIAYLFTFPDIGRRRTPTSTDAAQHSTDPMRVVNRAAQRICYDGIVREFYYVYVLFSPCDAKKNIQIKVP
jgi:hypothetical protein